MLSEYMRADEWDACCLLCKILGCGLNWFVNLLHEKCMAT